MKEERHVVAILFADLAGYSRIANDDLYGKLNSLSRDFKQKYINEGNHFYFNTWGDAFFICSYDPVNLLEIALQLRDWYRNTNWKKHGFPKSLPIRIGLHIEKATVIYEKNEPTNVIGNQINTAARIEPVVDENSIYCSEQFCALTSEDVSGFAKFVPIGTKELAKGFGKMPLYEIVRAHEYVEEPKSEPLTTTAFGMTVPRIKKDFTDEELAEFQRNGFRIIKDYFNKALKRIAEIDPEVSTNFEEAHANKIKCKIYVRGDLRATCQIFSIEDGFNQGIHYSTTIDDRDSSWNESVMSTHNGFEMFFNTMGLIVSTPGDQKGYSAEEIAHALWTDFAKQLEH